MIALLLGRCRACAYEATVGIGEDEEATVAVIWAPALCPACGLVSVNVADATKPPRCHECSEAVQVYGEPGALPEPQEGWPCPQCREPALAFRLAEL